MTTYALSNVTVPTTLDEDLTSGELDITVVDGSTYPSADFLIRINLEVIDIQSRASNVLTVRSGGRGVGDTVPAAHSTNDIVEHVLDVQDLPFRRTVGSVNWEAQGAIDLSNERLYAPLDPTDGLDVGDRDFNDGRYDAAGTAASQDHDHDTPIAAHAGLPNAHHNEAHSIASHDDTTATGAELETLTGGSETTLHSHAGGAAGAAFSELLLIGS